VDYFDLPLSRRVFFRAEEQQDILFRQEKILPYVTAEYPIDRTDEGFYIEVTLGSDAVSGNFKAGAPIHYKNETHVVTVMGHVRGKLVAIPSSLTFTPGNSIALASIQLRHSDGLIDFTRSKMEFDYLVDGNVNVEIQNKTSDVATVAISLNHDFFDMRDIKLMGTVFLHFMHDDNRQSIAIPIMYYSR
jgi:hypothetical protein